MSMKYAEESENPNPSLEAKKNKTTMDNAIAPKPVSIIYLFSIIYITWIKKRQRCSRSAAMEKWKQKGKEHS